MNIDFQALREQMTDESIKDILLQFDVEPVTETADAIIFPTCCHNLEGGSPKLYYYKDSKMFHCYTDCDASFDIFSLLQKIYHLRGREISVVEAVNLCGLSLDGAADEEIDPEANEGFGTYRPAPIKKDKQISDEIRHLQMINDWTEELMRGGGEKEIEIKTYSTNVLREFSFDYIGLMPWIKEGIGIESLQKFNIKYNEKQNAIVIPNFNIKGQLIGVRERFFNAKDIEKGKYRPMYWGGVLYNHPTGRTFYGIYENHKVIERKKVCIIFEGEKSVLKYGTIYGNENNIALATLGQNITRDHINFLTQMGVRDVILAYDTDYEDYEQINIVDKSYREKARILAQNFNVSYLMDYDFLLPYKSSPIDGGKEIFESILNDRRIV